MSQSTLSLLQGTVSLLILRALKGGPAHGYAITRWIHERTDGALAMEDAALYQALHRLEAKGGLRRSGAFPRTTGARSITPSPRRAGVSCVRKCRRGGATSTPCSR